MAWAVYARVSTMDQNINTQIEFLKKYALEHNMEEFVIYSDVGVSGARTSRPQFNLMLKHIRNGTINGVLVYKMDRIGRSTQHLLTLFEEFKNRGVKFVSATQNIDSTTPSGKLMMRLLMLLAEYERDVIRDRIAAGRARAKAEGKHLGRPMGAKDNKVRRKGGYYMRYMKKVEE